LKIKISDINIGPRFRKDMGDLRPLVDSIKRHGLLHPVVIDESNSLICGRRRIAAYDKLGITTIEASVIDLDNPRGAEADENIVGKSFTVAEIAEIDQHFREKFEAEARERQKSGKPVRNLSKGRSSAKIAIMVGKSASQIDKIPTLCRSASQDPILANIWKKVGADKMKVDKGYNQIKKFQRIKEAEKLACSSSKSNTKFDLKLGPMQEKGLEIADNSIDLILADPPYNEKSIPLYGDLAKLAQRVLKPGGSLITIIGHYALFKIGNQITDNSELEYHWQIVLKHNGHTAKMWKQRVWPKYKPMLWYYKRSGNGNSQGPTMYSDIEDLIESQPPDKTMHDWEQSTIEAKHIIKPLTVEGQIILDPFMGYGTFGVATLQLKRKFIGI
jgi:ParB family chromosome partitioning protein